MSKQQLGFVLRKRLDYCSQGGLISRASWRGRPREFFRQVPVCLAVGLMVALCGLNQVSAQQAGSDDSAAEKVSSEKKEPAAEWHRVSTEDRTKWQPCLFGGEGEIRYSPSAIHMTAGDPMTGVALQGEFPRDGYEIELESRRRTNFDFFCGLTFPVGESHCSLVLGGWAGAVVGLSSIDGEDASENATKTYMTFENDTWYKVRVRVDAERIQCWVDEKKVVDQTRKDHKFDIRVEMDLCRPVGVAAYMCDAEFRNFRWRKLKS